MTFKVPLDSELFLWNLSQVRGLSYRLTRQTGQVVSFNCWQVTEGLCRDLERALGFAGGAWPVLGRSTLEGDGQREADYWGLERKGSQCAGSDLGLLLSALHPWSALS